MSSSLPRLDRIVLVMASNNGCNKTPSYLNSGWRCAKHEFPSTFQWREHAHKTRRNNFISRTFLGLHWRDSTFTTNGGNLLFSPLVFVGIRVCLYVCASKSWPKRHGSLVWRCSRGLVQGAMCLWDFCCCMFLFGLGATHISHPVKRSIANSWRFRCPFYCTIWRFCGKLFPFHFRFRRVVARFSSPCLLLMQERFHGLGTVNKVIRRNSILLPSRWKSFLTAR